MAENFLEFIEGLEKNDQIIQALPKYSNNKKLKELSKELSERQKEAEKMSAFTQPKVLLGAIKDQIDRLKSTTEKFQSQYNSIVNLKQEIENLKTDVAKEEGDYKNLCKLEENLMAKREAFIAELNKKEEQKNKDFVKFVESLQEQLK